MLLEVSRAPNYRKRLGERYGIYANLDKPTQDGIVIYVASVGEVIAATPLVKRIQKDYPICNHIYNGSHQQALNVKAKLRSGKL